MIFSLSAAFFFIAFAPVAKAQNPMQSYFIPLPDEDLLYDAFAPINKDATRNVVSNKLVTLISFSISTDNTVIWYDHWEGGYELDIKNPISANIEIWGDGNSTNGCAPNINPCTNARDKLMAGDAIVVQNDITVPRNKNNHAGKALYDGRDMVYSSYPIAITRGAYPVTIGSPMAGCVEVVESKQWGMTFVAPIGPDLMTPNSTKIFKGTSYTAFFVMASEDGTEVTLPDGTLAYLMKGGGLNLEVKMGDRLKSNKKVQVHLLTGEKNSDYEMRWFALYPSDTWQNEYLSPVGDDIGPVRTVIYNDGSVDINVDVEYNSNGTTTTSKVLIKAKNFNWSPRIPTGSGAYFKSKSGENFLALTMVDVEQDFWTIGKWFDWGFPVVPRNLLSSQVLIGMGFGCTDNNCGDIEPRSVIWISTLEDADIWVDYNNTGINQTKIPIKRLDGIKIRSSIGPKKDMSGALIFATKPNTGPSGASVDIAAAWGQDPTVSEDRQGKSLDMGTVVLPMAAMNVFKTADKKIVRPGEKMRYTIKIVNVGQVNVPALSYTIIDNDMLEQTYVPGSTTYSYGAGAQAIQDDVNGTAFPLDGTGMKNIFALPRRGGIHEISFDVIVSMNISKVRVTNKGIASFTFGTYPFEAITPVVFDPKIRIDNTVYLGQKGLNSCYDSAVAKDLVLGAPQTPVTYCFKVTNVGMTYLKNPIIENPILKSIHRYDGILAPGAMWHIHYDTTQDSSKTTARILNDLVNVATVSATAVFQDGSAIDHAMLPVKHSDPSEVRVLPFDPAVRIENSVFGGEGDCELNGVEATQGVANTNLTYCFTITNTGSSFLRQLIVTNDDVKPTYKYTHDVVLAPGDSFLLTVPGKFDGNYSNTAVVVGTPALADGTILTLYAKPTHSDKSSIFQKIVDVDLRSGNKIPITFPSSTDPDTLTKCMTPHWRDAGGKQDLVCRANDIQIKSLSSDRGTCKEGSTIVITVTADLYFKTGLFDPTWFVATDGGDAKLGTCVLKGLAAGSSYTVTDPVIGDDAGVVAWNSDAIGGSDGCGDVLVDGGSVLVSGPFLHKTKMKCEDTNNDGNLDFSVCFSWRSKAKDGFCSLTNTDPGTKGDLADAYPSDSMTCHCTRGELPTVTVIKKTSSNGLKTC